MRDMLAPHTCPPRVPHTLCTAAFFLGMVYCVINPIICPTLLVYYILSMLTEKYLCMYTYKPVYESGGSNWSAVSA